ncbi:hypothetical protein D3C87_1815130 [compost metagenome]
MSEEGVDEMPRWVSRTGAGSTKIAVASRPGTIPMPKKTMAGIRYTKVGNVCIRSRIGLRTA